MTMSLKQAELEPQQMIARLDTFMAKIENLGNALGLDLSFAQADHIALRINETELAKSAHLAWSEYGSTISEAMINGRPIVVLAFDEPLQSLGWKIECLELAISSRR